MGARTQQSAFYCQTQAASEVSDLCCAPCAWARALSGGGIFCNSAPIGFIPTVWVVNLAFNCTGEMDLLSQFIIHPTERPGLWKAQLQGRLLGAPLERGRRHVNTLGSVNTLNTGTHDSLLSVLEGM